MKRDGIEGVSCRGCGATYAFPHPNQFGLCSNCWFAVRRRTEGYKSDPDEADVMSYLAAQVANKGKRLASGRSVGRCQCISTSGTNADAWGFQCGSIGNFIRDGRSVCHAHKRADAVVFVDDYAPDPWSQYKEMMGALCDVNPDFFGALREFCEERLNDERGPEAADSRS